MKTFTSHYMPLYPLCSLMLSADTASSEVIDFFLNFWGIILIDHSAHQLR